MVKLAEISRTSTFAWSHGCLPLLATGTVAGAVDANFSSQSKLELWDVFSPIDKSTPAVVATVSARFHALAWSKPFDGHAQGVIAGAFEDGIVEFWDAEILLKSKDLAKASVHRSNVHSGPVKTLQFHPSQDHVMVSGGAHGQLFVWDIKTFAEPVAPGQAMTPMDEVSCVAWNNTVPHIFASTGNGGYTLIWDLKAKREVLHLSYSGSLGRANFSCVAWHPTLSTKLVTASDNDGCPLILTWDLRNSNAPEKIMQGHKKGVLSLDWCAHDPELLISSGKDNSTLLWNPIKGEKLGEYPTTANWAYNTKFAPAAPDIFATASFDGKIVIQSLQDTSPPVLSKVASTNDDNDFWNEISVTDTQQPVFEISQAPAWLKTTSSVSFGFGSKLVLVSTNKDGQSVVNISKFATNSKFDETSNLLSKAINSGNFTSFIEEKVSASSFLNDTEKGDWELLKKLSETNKEDLLKEQLGESESKDEAPETKKEAEDLDLGDDFAGDDSFFDNLGSGKISATITKQNADSFVPSGEFSLINEKKDSDEDKKLFKLILNGNLEGAVTECIQQERLVEALIIALDGSDESKAIVKNEYFKKNQENVLSRLLYSASSKNVTDIVAHADVSNWKEIAASISAYAADGEDYNSKITELGDRILESKTPSRENAILCYLAGNALDKIAKIWLNELPAIEEELLKSTSSGSSSPSDARFEALNSFVEKIATYRSISKTNDSFAGPGIEPICKVILEYSNLVAGFGQFELAEKFLQLLPADFEGLKMEKDRIAKATGNYTSATTASNNRRGGSTSSATSRAYARPGLGGLQPAQPKAFVKSPAKQHASLSGNKPFVPMVPTAPPTFNRAPPPPAVGTPAPPVANAYGAPVQPVTNPYAPQGGASVPGPGAVPSFHNPYRPSTPSLPTTAAASNGSPAIPPPPKNAFRKDTDGWNDLPEGFKPKVAPRRPVASSSSPSPVQVNTTSTPSSIALPKRTSSVGPPTLPPPPKGISRTSSRQTVPTEAASIPHSPSQVSSRYAPPTPSVISLDQNNSGSRVASPSVHPAPPPKNPYAPQSTPAPVKTAFAPPTPPIVPSSTLPPTPSTQAPPKNPYAPVANNGPVAPTGYMLPPRTSSHGSQVNAFAGPPPPPPSGHASAHAHTPAPPPPPPAAAQGSNGFPPVGQSAEPPVKEKYPAGDRSHISEDALPIFTTLSSILDLIMPDLPEQYAKHGDAVSKRLNLLFDHLNNEDLLSAETVESLKEVCNLLENKEYEQALAKNIELATKHSEETGNWHPGVKHLIQMAQALL